MPLVLALLVLPMLALSAPAFGADAPKIDSGNTAWMLSSTALVLLMTIPGLALFYAGMVRTKNVLATLMQSFAICCLVTIVWCVIGYSLAFTSGNAYVGDLSQFMLQGFAKTWNQDFLLGGTVDQTISESVFSAMCIFMVLWSIIVYSPIAHWVWSTTGWAGAMGGLDFAGGPVVHINAGVAGLMCALVLGKRIGYGHDNMHPYYVGYAMIGASLLWVGWFGFNAGSAVAGQCACGHGDGGNTNRDGGRRFGLDVRRVDDQG
jgi:Amt family ammonium transporter